MIHISYTNHILRYYLQCADLLNTTNYAELGEFSANLSLHLLSSIYLTLSGLRKYTSLAYYKLVVFTIGLYRIPTGANGPMQVDRLAYLRIIPNSPEGVFQTRHTLIVIINCVKVSFDFK